MNNKQNQTIIDYLSGPRNYSEGVALYQKYGVNLRLKRVFATEDTAITREILFEEFRKIAGLSVNEFAKLPRRAVSGGKPKSEPAASETNVTVKASTIKEPVYPEATETTKKMIRFRDKFPFLNEPDCPDILKILVNDMFTAYDAYKRAFHDLQSLPDETIAEAAVEAEKVVNAYLSNREIWEELEYYKENGTILGKAAKFKEIQEIEDLSKLSDLDLIKQLNSASANESKHRKAMNTANAKGEHNEKAEIAFNRWNIKKTALQAEVARRKKK